MATGVLRIVGDVQECLVERRAVGAGEGDAVALALLRQRVNDLAMRVGESRQRLPCLGKRFERLERLGERRDQVGGALQLAGRQPRARIGAMQLRRHCRGRS